MVANRPVQFQPFDKERPCAVVIPLEIGAMAKVRKHLPHARAVANAASIASDCSNSGLAAA